MALFRLYPVAYPLLADGDKWDVQRRLERLVHAVQGDFSVWRVYRQAGDAGGRRPEVYVGVNLREDAPSGIGRTVLAAADRARAALAGLRPSHGSVALSAARLRELAEVEQRLYERLSTLVEIRRAYTRELEWLLRRAPLRGVAEPCAEPGWAPDALVVEDATGEASYEPLGWDLWRLPAAVLWEDPEHPPSLSVEADERDGFQAMLCAGALVIEVSGPSNSYAMRITSTIRSQHAGW